MRECPAEGVPGDGAGARGVRGAPARHCVACRSVEEQPARSGDFAKSWAAAAFQLRTWGRGAAWTWTGGREGGRAGSSGGGLWRLRGEFPASVLFGGKGTPPETNHGSLGPAPQPCGTQPCGRASVCFSVAGHALLPREDQSRPLRVAICKSCMLLKKKKKLLGRGFDLESELTVRMLAWRIPLLCSLVDSPFGAGPLQLDLWPFQSGS